MLEQLGGGERRMSGWSRRLQRLIQENMEIHSSATK
jgi:hypothetical protein